jgi:hypothetical protein
MKKIQDTLTKKSGSEFETIINEMMNSYWDGEA